MNKEFKIFEARGERSQNYEKLLSYLNRILSTCVFSNINMCALKLDSRLVEPFSKSKYVIGFSRSKFERVFVSNNILTMIYRCFLKAKRNPKSQVLKLSGILEKRKLYFTNRFLTWDKFGRGAQFEQTSAPSSPTEVFLWKQQNTWFTQAGNPRAQRQTRVMECHLSTPGQVPVLTLTPFKNLSRHKTRPTSLPVHNRLPR